MNTWRVAPIAAVVADSAGPLLGSALVCREFEVDPGRWGVYRSLRSVMRARLADGRFQQISVCQRFRRRCRVGRGWRELDRGGGRMFQQPLRAPRPRDGIHVWAPGRAAKPGTAALSFCAVSSRTVPPSTARRIAVIVSRPSASPYPCEKPMHPARSATARRLQVPCRQCRSRIAGDHMPAFLGGHRSRAGVMVDDRSRARRNRW